MLFLQIPKYEILLSETLHIDRIQYFLHAGIFLEFFTTSNWGFQKFQNKELPLIWPPLVHTNYARGEETVQYHFLHACIGLILAHAA